MNWFFNVWLCIMLLLLAIMFLDKAHHDKSRFDKIDTKLEQLIGEVKDAKTD